MDGSLAHERPPALRFGRPVRSRGLALVADLEHAGFMPPILHGVIREGRWPFSATGSGSLPASGVYGLSAEAQLHPYALIRNIQCGSEGSNRVQSRRRPSLNRPTRASRIWCSVSVQRTAYSAWRIKRSARSSALSLIEELKNRHRVRKVDQW